jgi:hypothetical protein
VARARIPERHLLQKRALVLERAQEQLTVLLLLSLDLRTGLLQREALRQEALQPLHEVREPEARLQADRQRVEVRLLLQAGLRLREVRQVSLLLLLQEALQAERAAGLQEARQVALAAGLQDLARQRVLQVRAADDKIKTHKKTQEKRSQLGSLFSISQYYDWTSIKSSAAV